MPRINYLALIRRKYGLRRVVIGAACFGLVGIVGIAYSIHYVASRPQGGKSTAGHSAGQVAGVSQRAQQSGNTVSDQSKADQNAVAGTDKATAPGSTGTKPASSSTGGRTAIPRYGSGAGCPAEFQPPDPLPAGGWTGPPQITKTVATQTVTIPSGQDRGSFTFTAPDEPVILYVNAFSNYPTTDGVTATLVSGMGQRTVTISVKPGSGSSMGQDHVRANSACYTYDIPISYYRESPPTLQFTSLNYVESSNSLSYTANGPVQSIRISYYLDGCDATTGACSDTDTVAGTGSSGVINFDPLFPQLDAYFASHTATAINLTITPIATGYTSVAASQVFALQ